MWTSPRANCELREMAELKFGPTYCPTAARQHSSTSALDFSTPALLHLVASSLYLRPAVLEGDGAVEHRTRGRGVGIDNEVAEALELEAGAGGHRGERWFELARFEHLERVRVERRQPVGAFGGSRIRYGEQPVVEAHFPIDGMRGRDPVQRRLHLAAVRGVATARGRVVRAAQLHDLAGGRIGDRLAAGDQVRVAE